MTKRDPYYIVCSLCGKAVRGNSEAMTRHNYKVHVRTHKDKWKRHGIRLEFKHEEVKEK